MAILIRKKGCNTIYVHQVICHYRSEQVNTRFLALRLSPSARVLIKKCLRVYLAGNKHKLKIRTVTFKETYALPSHKLWAASMVWTLFTFIFVIFKNFLHFYVYVNLSVNIFWQISTI